MLNEMHEYAGVVFASVCVGVCACAVAAAAAADDDGEDEDGHQNHTFAITAHCSWK